ncbi:DNA repair exonuclease SbcCD nuclease subunit [Scopulibacillus darangshiensis]|uniref:DNA repair exonuclease SbcCD nuclease subunit n=1 Tax=Scopulibacillus darangshiensis TaxID=442528 RepID=A0A4R2P3U1_9BACL|nr:DNA repair exonuclease [Scopulibacillus darangshiensis]TCP29287.1 DNA repair exonuclease SbcCD nuclease subunit [Scopulibacillus darangshiensis]
MAIRFIHTADWHLDRPFKGVSHLPEVIRGRVRESTFTALNNLVNRAIVEKVDFIVIAGDIFDQSHRSLKAQQRFNKAMSQLNEHGIVVFLSHGNHDHLGDQWNQLKAGDNVCIFGPKIEMMPYQKPNGERVHLYGFSYPQRHVMEDQTQFYKKIEGADFHIALLHGSVQGDTEHDTYAPFSVQSLAAKDFDYWALGHIHKRQRLSENPDVWYSGNIQGLTIKETGEKGVLLVELDDSGSSAEFIPTADILWHDETVDISACQTIDDLLDKIDEQKESLRSQAKGIFLRIELIGNGPLHHTLQSGTLMDDILDTIRDGEDDRDSFVWVTFLKDDTAPDWHREDLLAGPHFIGDLLRLSQAEELPDMKESLSQLLGHRRAKRYVESPKTDDICDIYKEAEALLIDALYEKKGTDR